ncbi:MAG: hypothetical protein GX596_12825 [Propionibacterium sp.]|nr:hypothetical protein [Propionibacterium sp.]
MSEPYYDILGPRAKVFIETLRDEVAELGGVMDPDGRSAAMPDGAGYNFDNLARSIPAEASEQEIADGVRMFLGGLREAPNVRDYSWDELKMRLRTRLSARVAIEGDETLVKPLAQDLMQTINVDFPNSVVTLTDASTLARLGVEPQQAMHIALINTAAELSQADIEVHNVDGDVWALSSESFFTSGLVILLDEVLPLLLDREFDLDQGLLIAVPNRHVVLVGFLDAPGSLIAGVTTMTKVAMRLIRSQPGAISGSVYYSDRDGIQRIAHVDRDVDDERTVILAPSERLQQRMQAGEI